MIYRGTTPTHTFEMPFDCENLTALTITYAQNDMIVLKKSKEDCIVKGANIIVKLSQEDTLRFNDERGVKMQVKILNGVSDVYVSDIITASVGEVLDEEVID